jgi:hypothetical protein
MESEGREPEKELALPDTTKAQIGAVVQAVIAVAVAFGAPVTDEQSVALIALAGVIGAVLIGADASIRRERARNAHKLRPRAQVTQTSTEDGVERTATIDVPLPQGTTTADFDDRVRELIRGFEIVSKFLEAERARESAANGSTKPRSPSGSRPRTTKPAGRPPRS